MISTNHFYVIIQTPETLIKYLFMAIVALFCLYAFPPLFCLCFADDGQATLPKNLSKDNNNVPKPPAKQMPKPSIAPLKPVKTNDEPIPNQTSKPLNDSNNKTAAFNTIFEDSFGNDSVGWPTMDNKDAFIQVRDGVYIFSHKRKEESWVAHRSIGFRAFDDFVIETVIRKKDGDLGMGYGIMWGYQHEPREYNSFCIQATGHFFVSHKKNGDKAILVVDRSESHAINKGTGTVNILKVERKGNVINCYINNIQVASTQYTPTTGSRCGFIVFGRQSVEILKLSYMAKTS